ncbi:Polyphenol oxidase, chloroplastic precursor [Zea mays]|uniref:Putative polyphenol oxidase family protein n=1 Tax=Zea mays TaxID=4577 RepID=K7VJ76_MAIZE|nr:Polyphenol oxidase, chloroplastic precursor [Zea mays]AQL04970.1 Putative polyphenol oxidase family protein [Zea mays]
MAGSNGTLLLALRIVLFCALASVATTLLPLVTRPCAYSLPRTILAASGLDPRLISCADDGSAKAQLSDGDGGHNKAGSGGRPIVTDLLSCGEPRLPSHALPPFRCCPPTPASDAAVANFTFPDPGEPLRTRQPAHGAAGADSVARYARAVALMKALPESDPRSFYQQANIHCAYCTAAYRQAGRPELHVQIHFSWLFFPFHRAYLYFFERVAARLLGDPGFAVPFWSWDVPEGMRVPPEFADAASPLYDPIRNPEHAPPRVVDLDFSKVDKNYTDEQQIQLNLRTMYKQMVTNAPLPSLFYGQPYRAGDREMPGAGTVELSPHNTIHVWAGDLSQPNHENMGTYYSAARDPIFFPHHTNSDRLWEVWRGGPARHADFTDPDWLDSSFLFYDEDARLVRVTVRDMLDIGRLRYAYAEVGLPWLSARPPINPGDVNRGRDPPHLESVRFPVSLDAPVTAEVSRRPGKPRSHWEEVLVVEGIKADGADFVKFDVYVNAVDHEKIMPGGREMAGSFVSLKHPGNMVVQSSMRVALNELLEDLGAEGDDSVTVTLVPVEGRVRIGGLRIVYMAE